VRSQQALELPALLRCAERRGAPTAAAPHHAGNRGAHATEDTTEEGGGDADLEDGKPGGRWVGVEADDEPLEAGNLCGCTTR